MLIFPVDCFILLCFQNNPSACSWGDFGITLCKEHFTNLTRTNELVWMIPTGSFELKMFQIFGKTTDFLNSLAISFINALGTLA